MERPTRPRLDARLGESRIDVLLADHDELFRRRVAAALERDGYVVRECEGVDDLTSAIRMARGDGPRIVVTDVRLRGGGSGLDVVRRARAELPTMPILLLASYVDETTRASAQSAGASAVMSKPVQLDDLRTAVMLFVTGRPPLGRW